MAGGEDIEAGESSDGEYAAEAGEARSEGARGSGDAGRAPTAGEDADAADLSAATGSEHAAEADDADGDNASMPGGAGDADADAVLPDATGSEHAAVPDETTHGEDGTPQGGVMDADGAPDLPDATSSEHTADDATDGEDAYSPNEETDAAGVTEGAVRDDPVPGESSLATDLDASEHEGRDEDATATSENPEASSIEGSEESAAPGERGDEDAPGHSSQGSLTDDFSSVTPSEDGDSEGREKETAASTAGGEGDHDTADAIDAELAELHEAAVSGWAAHEWRLEWEAAMDERDEEVFHVKPPEDADAAASFSIDDDDTPLARELADLTARRKVLDDVRLDLSGKRTRVMTVSNQKGGVGKTTSSVNLAAALADLGARVLVIDLDPQGNASTALNVPHTADVPSVYDVLIDEFPLADIIQVSPESPNLLCAPSTIHLAGAEIELVSQVAREHRLKTALDDYLAHLDEQLDFVLIDCPPSLGLLTINAFTAAQEVLLPIQCEYYALEGLSQLLATVRMIQKHLNPELRLSTILLTMYDGRTRLSQQVADEVRAHFPNEVLNSVIPRSVRVSEAPSFGQTVIAYDGQSAGAVAYREAAVEIVARGEHDLATPTADGADAGSEDEHDVNDAVHAVSEGGA